MRGSVLISYHALNLFGNSDEPIALEYAGKQD